MSEFWRGYFLGMASMGIASIIAGLTMILLLVDRYMKPFR